MNHSNRPDRSFGFTFRSIAVFIFTATLVLLLSPALAALIPVDLRCEYLHSPFAVDEKQPRLTWRFETTERGQKQNAYRIIVATTEDLARKGKGDLWDSKKVKTSDTVSIPYAGIELPSRQDCFWRVQAWDQDDKLSVWSEMGRWKMALLEETDWKARYISFRDNSPVWKDTKELYLPPARQYRKEFRAEKKIRRATIYATALGIYELDLNGQRVSTNFFAPGWTDYHQRAYYNTYDVTSMVHEGANAVGAWVADGWYSGYIGFGLLTGIGTEKTGRNTYGKTPALMAQLEIQYTDGSMETIITDATWKVTDQGPIQQADFLMGESYDARKQMRGWARPGFDDSSWDQAIVATANGSAKATFYEFQNPAAGNPEIKGRPIDLGFKRPPLLQAFPGVPVKQLLEIRPIAITSPTNDVYIFNLGQNFAGVVRLKVNGSEGTKIRLRYGEMLHPDGRLMTENLRKARATDFYTLRGAPEGETYTPRFTFHGFQYVEVTGYPGKPGIEAITGIVMHSDTPFTSHFECSDSMANKLFTNIVWTQRANFIDLPTDCPQRDERFGWTGDAQTYVRTATYNADVSAFYTKWLRELMESQRPSGTFPGYAPFPFQHGWDFGTAWCDAGVICPWTIFTAYGDRRIIDKCWDRMEKFIEWRQAASKDDLGVSHGNAWGDWLALSEKTPLEYVDTIFYAYSVKLMAEMAQATERKDRATHYRNLYAKIQKAFQEHYMKPDGRLLVDTQTAYAQAIFVGLIPANLRQHAGELLAKKIHENDNRMGTGFLGTRALLPALTAAGQNDLAVRLFQSRKFPSWGYEVSQGATTIWERWNSYTIDHGFGGEQNASMNSFSHYAFGAVCEWMFSSLAGIDADSPGYRTIIIRPMSPGLDSDPDQKPIDWVKGHYDSIQGRIVSSWKRSKNTFDLETTIPANTTAIVYMPARDKSSVKESNLPISGTKNIKFLRQEDGRSIYFITSGAYHFTSQL